ncbi:MAG: MG2 domain-containing protein, partial [Acidimicrobiia bacterium]|nr:MG2 domain-containing protein [Acidimicrobiia bacterium]
LAPASPLTLTIGPGTPSAEGPLTSAEASTHAGRTFDALAVTERACNYGGPCQPGTPFIITFNNAIDPELFDPSTVTADPAIAGMRVGVFGNQMTITGATRARTDYTIKLPSNLTDVFGQNLGEEVEATFEVGPAPTQLVPFNRQHLTVDPMAERAGISVATVNHDSVKVTAWKVEADDLPSFQRYLERFWSDTDPGDPDWPQVYDREVDTGGDDDTMVETFVDLSDAFAESPDGQLVVRVAPTREFDPDDDSESESFWMNRPSVAWVQSSTLGIDTVIDNDELLIWTTDLVTGQPRGGVEVELVGTGTTVTTDDGGVAQAPLSGRVRGLLGRDPDAQGAAAVGLLASSWYDGWESQQGFSDSRWYVFDDRGIYKPGETVRVTGWLRKQPTTGEAQLGLYDGRVSVNWRAYDPFGNELGSGDATANRLGGFNFRFDVPDESNLGFGYVEMEATGPGVGRDGAYGSHQFQVQDFRTPEFEVTARPESPAPYYVADPATIAVDAAYFAGGPLPDADVAWTVTSAKTTYRPPRWDQYTFGIWQPWWFDGFEGGRYGGPVAVDVEYGFGADIAEDFPGGCFGPGCPEPPEVERFSGRTDGNGHHFLRLDFDGPGVDLPNTVIAEAAVTDVNRQMWASRTDLLVHPARYYVGLRSDRPFVEQGTPLRIDAVVTDVDGTSVAGRTVEVTAGRLEQVWS